MMVVSKYKQNWKKKYGRRFEKTTEVVSMEMQSAKKDFLCIAD